MVTTTPTPAINKILLGQKVLIVEDSKIIRGVYEMYLAESGGELVFAENGWEGLDLLKHMEPRLILLDMDMPLMDGATFLRYFSCSALFRRVPVVIVSARTQEEVGERTLRLAGHYVRKPFGPFALKQAVQVALRGV